MAKGLSKTSNDRVNAWRRRKYYLQKQLRERLEAYRDDPSGFSYADIWATVHNLDALGIRTELPAWFKLIQELDQ